MILVEGKRSTEPNFQKKLDHKKVNIKDVAEKSGVSIGTVDRVIHKRGEVSENTRVKVLRVIKELNYQPNLIARSLASKKKVRLVILLPKAGTDDEYWHYPQIGIRKALNEISDHGPVIHLLEFELGDKQEYLKQLNLINTLSYDGLLTAAIYPTELSAFIRNHKSEKAIILIDSNIPEANVDFVGQDAERSGLVAGKLMDLLIPRKRGKILIPKMVSNVQSMPIVLKRIDGFKEYFKSVAKNPIIDEATFTIKPNQKTVPELEKLLKKGYHAVFVPNSRSYLITSNTRQKINLIGYDLIDQNVQLLKQDKIDFVISQQPERQGYMAIMRLFNKLIGKVSATSQYHLPIDVLMKENVDNYINRQMEFKSDIGY